MFRRRTKRKDSVLGLHSSNRGSDIVGPDNTSLLVNESNTESDFLRKELSSIFSDDEDNLGDSTRSSSLIRSLSQKKQSTPLSQSFRGKKIFPPSNTKDTLYFDEVLKSSGATPLPGYSSYLISEDQAVFSIKVNNMLKQSPENTKKFFDSLKKKIEDDTILQKMLSHTLTDENCETARGPIQEPLMKILLNVECLQADLIKLLLNRVADSIVEKSLEKENIQLVSSILCQMKFLRRTSDIQIAPKLFEIIEVSPINVKREIIFLLPEIISVEETQETCIQLVELLKLNEMLTHVIIDALIGLPLSNAMGSFVCSKILQRLDKCPLEFLPSLVQFVLNKCQTEELSEIVNGLRNNLPFSPQHYQIRGKEKEIEKKHSDDESYVKLVFENLKFSSMASKEITDAWIKIISGIKSCSSFRCLDLVMLLIFYSCLFNRKSQILQLIRSKIKSEVLAQCHLENIFKILPVITEEYSSTLLEIASILLKSFDAKVSSFGALLYRECFTHFHPYMKEIVISEMLLHIGIGPSPAANSALYALKELCENNRETLSHHTASVMGLLVKVSDLDLIQVQYLMDVITGLVFYKPFVNAAAAQEELQIFIRKQLISSKPEQCKKGVLGAIMFGKHFGKEYDPEDTNCVQCMSLLDLVMCSNGSSEAKLGFFNDEFARMVKESNLSESFLKIWSDKVFDLVDSVFAKSGDANSVDFPTSAQYRVHSEGTREIFFPIVDIVLKSNGRSQPNISVSVIPSALRLLWCLERNLDRILPVFCASVILHEKFVYDDFISFDEDQKNKVMDCLFLCGNYFIECVNALCAHGIIDKAALRIKQLVDVRKLIAGCINLIPDYVPSLYQFYSTPQKDFLKKKTSERKSKKGRKRKLNEAPSEPSRSFLDSQSEILPATCTKEEQAAEEADLCTYSCFFRDLDFATSILLTADFTSETNLEKQNVKRALEDSVHPQLETSDILFLLEDLISKSEQILKPPEAAFNFKGKKLVTVMPNMSQEKFILDLLKIMPDILNKIETFSKNCENLLESNNWNYSSRGLFVKGACHVKLAMTAGLKLLANIVSWEGFQNSKKKLLKDFLFVLAGRGNLINTDADLESLEVVAVAAANYLASFSKTVLVLSGGLSIVKSCLACLRCSASDSKHTLANLCQEFLHRNWYTVTGDVNKGSAFNNDVDFLLKNYFFFAENKLEKIHMFVQTSLCEVRELTEKDSVMKSFKTINKSNFPLLYRTVCETLVATSTVEFSNTTGDDEKQLHIWSKVVEILLLLVEIAKVRSSRVILASLLKRSQSVIQLFLTKGMPVVESALRMKSVEVLALLKSFQIVTRFLHSICCHSRITNDSVVAAHVPAIRSLCERLTLEVKGMMILNGIPMDCITIAILKNKDIKGNDIISQENFDDDSEDDSQLPSEEAPEVEEHERDISDEETTEDNSESESDKADESKPNRNVEFVEDSEAEGPLEKPKLCCSTRLLFSMTCFMAIFNMSYVRVGISMALLCMVIPDGKNRDPSGKKEEFAWSSSTKGYITSAVFYGFLVGPCLAGFLSFKVGGKIILVIGSVGSSVTYFLAPGAARLTPILFFALRVVTGFFSGFTFPAYYDLVSHWIVPEERQLLVTGALVGIPLANIVNYPLGSIICDACGWIWLFYTFAIWMLVWSIVYVFTLFNYPENCPFISEKELRFLQSRIPKLGHPKIPWKKIVKSLPIYAYFVIHFCVNYVYLSIVFSLPDLMKTVHHFPLTETGMLSATPFVGSFVVRIFLSLFFEQLRQKLKVSTNTLRKIFVFLGSVLVSLFLLISTFLSCSYRYWVLGCFILASSSLELCLTGGYLLSLLDLCPSYVNILTGIANNIGSTAGLICPVVTGLITRHGTREEWNAVFYVNISILLGAMVFYLVFGQNSLLYWGLATLPSQTPVPRASLVN